MLKFPRPPAGATTVELSPETYLRIVESLETLLEQKPVARPTPKIAYPEFWWHGTNPIEVGEAVGIRNESPWAYWGTSSYEEALVSHYSIAEELTGNHAFSWGICKTPGATEDDFISAQTSGICYAWIQATESHYLNDAPYADIDPITGLLTASIAGSARILWIEPAPDAPPKHLALLDLGRPMMTWIGEPDTPITYNTLNVEVPCLGTPYSARTNHDLIDETVPDTGICINQFLPHDHKWHIVGWEC